MNSPPEPGATEPTPIRWYARSALGDFLAEAEVEQARLERAIADANARYVHANAPRGVHQTMVEMLLEAQSDIREIRRAADAQVAAILFPGGSPPQRTVHDGIESPASREGQSRTGTDEEFFDYLKGSLAEGAPLGPLPQ